MIVHIWTSGGLSVDCIGCMCYGMAAPYSIYCVDYTGDISKADEAVLIAKKNMTLSQFESSEVGQELAYLLDRASYLGLKSKVEEIRQELTQLHARAMMGTLDYAEVVSGSVMKDERENVQER